ncbi:uncharacterized protein LOC126844818 isoform X2 [Adelges cooleyi]|nr:uncharacterized protein LOC126844818 isoform X2 [Adelges cooleyi]XP_050439198.1 uncharacterized protein LOC126844818 isoform X2 [Adelges cooleyi]XP_050439199.1 uncharacterized protein LOC126844818 isoform X2 [Adelges cooleyi]
MSSKQFENKNECSSAYDLILGNLNLADEILKSTANSSMPTKLDLMGEITTEIELYNSIKKNKNNQKKKKKQKNKELKVNDVAELKKETKLEEKNLETIFSKINELYTTLFTEFEVDIEFLTIYIEYCKKNDLIIQCSTFLSTIFSISEPGPDIYLTVARFEYKERKNISRARQYYKSGICKHGQCKELRLEEVLMEVEHCDMSERCVQRYRSAIHRFAGDIYFHVQLLNSVYRIKPKSLPRICSIIVSDMVNAYKHNEIAWDQLAKLELKGYTYDSTQEESERLIATQKNFVVTVKNCVYIYEDTLRQKFFRVNKKNLWILYLEAIIGIRNSNLMKLPAIRKYMQATLKRAFHNAHTYDVPVLNSKYYLYWTQNSSIDERWKFLPEAVEIIKTDVQLWTELMALYVIGNRREELLETFQRAVKVLKNDSLPLWRHVFNYLHRTSHSLLEQLYIEGSNAKYKELAQTVRSDYLDWCILVKGVEEGRIVFNSLKNFNPPCQKLYMRMIKCEENQIHETGAKDSVRQLYSEATEIFGKTNIEVWIESIRFELKFGTTLEGVAIYEKSLKSLDAKYIPDLKSEYKETQIQYKLGYYKQSYNHH